MKNFADFQLPKQLADSLEAMKFDVPTPIQAQAIPHALDGRDILGSAQTGTGKTAAFMIPVLAKLFVDETASVLIMSPTRELATQIMDMTRKLMGAKSGIRTALLIGGEPMFKQFKQLDARPRIIIGTPGRIDDHCRRNRSLLDTTHMLVLDEADRMLDMGFSTQIDSILKYMPEDKHTLMFSATFSDKIIKFAQRYLNNPVRVAVKPEKITADKIKHEIIQVRSREDKFDRLMSELETREGSVIIFVKTKRNADQLSKRLCDTGNDNVSAQPIHGDLRQRQRDNTIKGFQAKRFRILVATDVASRGLDIPHIEHVINFDLPQNPEDYVHRIGRTARAGAEGNALCFITPSEGRDWNEIERMVFPHKTPTPFNDNGPSKKSGGYKGKGRGGKPSFGSNAPQGNKFGKPRAEGGQKRWDSNERPANRDARPARFNRDERPAAQGDRPERSFDRSSAPRSDRPERSFDRSSEPRGDRPEKKFSRPGAPRPEGRFDNRNEGNKTERSDNRPDNRGNRPEGRDTRPDDRGNRFEKPAQGGKPAFKKRDDRPARSSNAEGYAKRTERADGSKPDFFEKKAGSGDNRTPRSESFKKSEGFKKEGGFKKSGGFAKKSGGFSKPARTFKKAV